MTNNKEWLEQREQDWSRVKGKLICDDSNEQIEIAKKYFFEGDIKTYLEQSKHSAVDFVIVGVPVQTLEELICIIKIYWDWVLDNPHERGSNRSIVDMDLRFMDFYEGLLITPIGNYLPAYLTAELFLWVFGETYEEGRVLPIGLGKDNWHPEIRFDIDSVCSQLVWGVRDYLFGYENKKDIIKYKSLIKFFLSLYPLMDPDCYSKKVIKNDKVNKRGRKIRSAYQYGNRYLIAGLHGYITEYEQEDDISELTVNDQEALDYLKKELKKLKMPKRYYTLVDFVLEHKEACLYA